MKKFALIAGLLFFNLSLLFGGVVWQASIISQVKDKESKIIIRGYAQQGMVREEYVEVSDDKNALTKAGMYWLYHSQSNKVFIVDPQEKTYFEMNIDSIMQFMGAVGKFINFTLSNQKIEVKELPSENILGIDCRHFQINTSYDMETKIMIMKVKSHTEETKEIWAAGHLEDISLNYSKKSFASGFTALDSLVRKEMEVYGNIGFILKSITRNKTTDAKNKVVSEKVTEMTVTELNSKELAEELFQIPKDYKQISFTPKYEDED